MKQHPNNTAVFASCSFFFIAFFCFLVCFLAAVVGDEAVATVGAKLSDQQWDNIKSQKSLF